MEDVAGEMIMKYGYANPLGVILNVLQIAFMKRKKKTKLPFEKTVISLALADLLVSMLGTLLLIVHYIWKQNHDTKLNTLMTVLGYGLLYSISSSICHALFIAVQRIFAVFLPIKFKLYFSCRICIISLVLIWVSSLSLNVYVSLKDNFTALSYIIFAVACLLAICYILICYRANSQRRSRLAMSSSSQQQNDPTCKILVYSIFVTTGFILCTLPVAVAWLRIYQRHALSLSIQQFSAIALSLNPVIDSLLYFIFNYIRRAKNCYHCHCCCCGSGSVNSREENDLRL